MSVFQVTFADDAWQDAVEQTLGQWIGWTLDVNGRTCTLREVGVDALRSNTEFPALRVEWWDDEDGDKRHEGLIDYGSLESVHVY